MEPRTTIDRLLSARADSQPARAAFAVGRADVALSWRELAVFVSGWSIALADAAPRRTRVAVRIADPLAFIGAYLAGLDAAMVVVPLSRELGRGECVERMAAFGVDLVLTDDADLCVGTPTPTHLVDARDGVVLARLGADGAREHTSPDDGLPPTSAAAAGSALLTTGGTTGSPKAVLLDEQRLLYAAAAIVRHHRLGPADVGYSPLPLSQVNAQVVGILAALLSGATLVVDEGFHPDHWDVVAGYRATWLNTVPAILALLADLPAPDESVARRLRFARSTSAPLTLPVERAFERHTGVGVLETYGMTEAASQITANPLRPERRRPGSVGLPVAVDVRVVDPAGHECRPDVEGTVEIRGASVIDWYELPGGGRAKATDSRGWLRTDDLGRQDLYGFLTLAGRTEVPRFRRPEPHAFS